MFQYGCVCTDGYTGVDCLSVPSPPPPPNPPARSPASPPLARRLPHPPPPSPGPGPPDVAAITGGVLGPLGFLALLWLAFCLRRRRSVRAEVAEVVEVETRREALWRKLLQAERDAAYGKREEAVEEEEEPAEVSPPAKEYVMTPPSRARVAPISSDTIFF